MPVPLYLGERGTPGRRRIGDAEARADGTLVAHVTDPDVIEAMKLDDRSFSIRPADPFAEAVAIRSREDLLPHLAEALDRRAAQCATWGLTPNWRDEVQFVEGWRAAARLPEAREVASLLNAHADGRPEATDATIRAAVSDLLRALGVEA